MITSMKRAAFASVLMLTAGSTAWAGNNNANTGAQGNIDSGSQSALSQSSPAPGAAITADTQQKIRQSLEQSGFKDIRVIPESFVVRAQAPDGSHIVMLLSPDQVTGFVMGNAGSGMQDSGSQKSGARGVSQPGFGNTPAAAQQQAQQELSRYGYTALSDLRPIQGWSADATRNGENVRVMLTDNGLVATFPGR